MVLFLRNKRFNVMLFWADYYLRWWRLPIEERACRKTDLGYGDYYLRNSGLPPSSNRPRIRPGTVKILNAPWELSQLALALDYDMKIDHCFMLVWLGRCTVPQNRVSTRCYLAGRYKLGRSCSNSNLLRGQSKLLKSDLWIYIVSFHDRKQNYLSEQLPL